MTTLNATIRASRKSRPIFGWGSFDIGTSIERSLFRTPDRLKELP
jgi:hypothetical protein